MGKVIAVEGLDLVGKSTLIKKLKESLGNVSVYPEPYYGNELQKDLRKLVIDPRLPKHIQRSIVLGLRHELYLTKVIPDLDKGKHVITDRSCLTTAVYQSDLITSPASILNENEFVSSKYRHNFIPDIVIYMSIPHAEYLRRLRHRAEVEGEVIEAIELERKTPENYSKALMDYTVALRAYAFSGGKVIQSNDLGEILTLLKGYGVK